MNNPIDIRTALRSFYLPYDGEDDALGRVTEWCNANYQEEDHGELLRTYLKMWERSDDETELSEELVEFLTLALGTPAWALTLNACDVYRSLHKTLTGSYLFTHANASKLLVLLPQIHTMSTKWAMSASAVSESINRGGKNIPQTGWDEIYLILSKIRKAPTVSEIQVATQVQIDDEAHPYLLKDADLVTTIDLIAEIAKKLSFPEDIHLHLSKLYPSDYTLAHAPYHEIIEYSCALQEFWDHPPEYLYEFKPRGIAQTQTANVIGTPGGNAFLNNAKAVYCLDENWRRGKKLSEWSQANSLDKVIKGLGQLTWHSRRELSMWLRMLNRRYIQIARPDVTVIPTPDYDQTLRIIDHVASGQCDGSKGVLEQRLVDCLVSLKHSAPTWSATGIGDSVNASNLSRKKLGDVEFYNADNLESVSYEAHGGKLTQLYVDEHIRSLSKILEHRIELWESLSIDPSSIIFKVMFLANETQLEDRTETINGLIFAFEFKTIESFKSSTIEGLQENQISQHFKALFLDPLNQPNVPQVVRNTIINLLEA